MRRVMMHSLAVKTRIVWGKAAVSGRVTPRIKLRFSMFAMPKFELAICIRTFKVSRGCPTRIPTIFEMLDAIIELAIN